MKTPKTLNDDECFRLLDHIMTGYANPLKRPKVIRNHTMALLMLDAGLRVGELTKLLVRDFIINNTIVTNLLITREIAKRHHERVIPLTERIRLNIKQMDQLIWRPPHATPGPYAFVAYNKSLRITTRQVERIIKRASIESIGRPIHPHVLRHTFASRLMRRTSMRVVQELLGHKNLSSTQIYTHPNNNDLTEAINSIQKGKTNEK